MKPKTGYIYKDKDSGKWVARLTYTDQQGKRRNVKRHCATKTDAQMMRQKLLRELAENNGQALEGGRLRFSELAARYSAVHLVPAQFDQHGKVVCGVRSLASRRSQLLPLLAQFGNYRLQAITPGALAAFKLARLRQPTRHGASRSVAAVNRELELLRAMLNFAVRENLLARNPFQLSTRLIITKAENARQRVLSYEEEERLLACCTGKLAVLQPIIVCAVDSGIRKGELLKLEWRDVNIDAATIKLRPETTKDNRPREIAMTERLRAELSALQAAPDKAPDGRVFHCPSIQTWFAEARTAAGLSDVHFHDLRHCFVTRAIAAGMPPAEAARVSGHASLTMLNRYLNPGPETARRVADALDRLRLEQCETSGQGLIH